MTEARPVPLPQASTRLTLRQVEALFDLPFMELVFQAATVHRAWLDPSEL